MRVFIKQVKRELFTASFEIIQDNYQIGSIEINGKLGSSESLINVKLGESEIMLKREHGSQKKEKNAYRPYDIIQDNSKYGEIFHATKKIGLFKAFAYQYLCINDKEYEMFPIGFGGEGVKNPVFCGERQVALILKSAVVVDDMHDFELVIMENEVLLDTIIIVSYMYTVGYFKPGEKMKKGVVKILTRTTCKELISRYDASFESMY